MNIDWFKFLILLIVGLVVVGPEKLPSYARKAAKVIRNFQKVTDVISGQITRAMDLDDDEGGKASDFKKDLMAVKRTLEADVADLKSVLDSQARAITETVDAGTKEAAASFKKQTKEISDTVNTQVSEFNAALQEQAKVISATVETGINPTVPAAPAANQLVVEAQSTTAPFPQEPVTVPEEYRETAPQQFPSRVEEPEAE
jgi:sec-independent protein translocase protein TatB